MSCSISEPQEFAELLMPHEVRQSCYISAIDLHAPNHLASSPAWLRHLDSSDRAARPDVDVTGQSDGVVHFNQRA